ncbi:hypothetical protein A9K66_00130 [Mesorhizobium sp. AA23]|nr:hypothetical protein A9K66_00130 [Mesorhizobium sp. AA23]
MDLGRLSGGEPFLETDAGSAWIILWFLGSLDGRSLREMRAADRFKEFWIAIAARSNRCTEDTVHLRLEDRACGKGSLARAPAAGLKPI